MTQPAPVPALPLQYDNTRPDTLVRILRLFCYAQIAASIIVLARTGVQLVGSFLGTGYSAGPFLNIAQSLVYSLGPFVSNALLLITALLALQLTPAALTWARVYCVAAWVTQIAHLFFVPFAAWSYYSRGVSVAPSIVVWLATTVLSGLAGFVFPTTLYLATRIPAVRDLFRPTATALG
jgi:hypothetical protein